MRQISLSRILAHWDKLQADTIAICHEDESIDWHSLERDTNRLARAYAELGVKENDFVTIALPNGIEFFKSCFATWKLGATPQPVSAKLPRLERDQIIELGQPSLVVGVDDGSDDTIRLHLGTEANGPISSDPLEEKTAYLCKARTS